jgi:copper chaperone CopZ
MCCQGCVQKVAAQLYALPGVTSVQGDVPKRLVTITAKPSPKLTLERIWQAVEKAKGGPSKLVSRVSTYTLTRSEKLQPEQRLATGRYLIEVASLQNIDETKSIADELRRLQGVERIGVDLPRRMLAIDAADAVTISPWALVNAVERAHRQPISVSGPFGVLAIERLADAASHATAGLAVPQNSTQNQGGLR